MIRVMDDGTPGVLEYDDFEGADSGSQVLGMKWIGSRKADMEM